MKVLLVSHNCFSKTQNMGKTFASLFSNFKKEELMQLYLYPTIPNIDICDNYFRITDMDAVRSIIKRGKCGQIIKPEVIDESETLFESIEEAEQYGKINRNSFLIRRFRDLAWKISAWKSKELKQWLKEGKPDVVFYAMGDATFSQDIAMWVSAFLNIPLVTYVCDEFYFYYKKTNKFNLGLVSNIKKTMKKSKKLVTICDSLGKAYLKEFNVPYQTVMTGSSFDIGNPDHRRSCDIFFESKQKNEEPFNPSLRKERFLFVRCDQSARYLNFIMRRWWQWSASFLREHPEVP